MESEHVQIFTKEEVVKVATHFKSLCSFAAERCVLGDNQKTAGSIC